MPRTRSVRQRATAARRQPRAHEVAKPAPPLPVEAEAGEPAAEVEDLNRSTPTATVTTADDREFDRLFHQWKQTGNAHLREQLIERNRKLVRFLARQFKDRGEPLDDLMQVGNIGLINAVDRYDPRYGWKFSTFATPTIVGEIKRYFRDKGWSMKVPRRLQELNLEATKRIDLLTQELGRSPTYKEIAYSLNAGEEEVMEALEMAQAYDLKSLDSESPHDDGDGSSLADQIGVEDADLENWVLRMDLNEALHAALDPRERRVVLLVFFQERSQTEIARELGMSQMHVSRIQRKALSKLKDYMRKQA